MPSSTTSTATPPRHSFERRLEEVKPLKSDIVFLIMDYFVNEGYPDTAKSLAKEANIPSSEDIDSIQERVQIRTAIQSGDIQKAIANINELNPQILDSDPALHFALLRLQLVELIRTCTAIPGGDIIPALEFATNKLAPKAPTNPQFLQDLESTMALLIFPRDNLDPSLAEILDPSLRSTVANKVNEAILSSQGARREAKIRNLMRLRAWAEAKARESKKISNSTDLSLKLEGERGSAVQDSSMTDVREETR